MTQQEWLDYYKKSAQKQNELESDTIARQKQSMTESVEAENAQLKATAQRKKQEVGDVYREIYDENAVNQYVSERRVAESMANYGLTDSGLNRTQQTAVALMRGNADSKTRLQEQAAIDSIEQSLSDSITQNEMELNDYKNTLDDQHATNSAQRLFDAEVTANEQYIAELEKTENSTVSTEDVHEEIINDIKDELSNYYDHGGNVSDTYEIVHNYVKREDLTREDIQDILTHAGVSFSVYETEYGKEMAVRDIIAKTSQFNLTDSVDEINNNINILDTFLYAFEQYHVEADGGDQLMPALRRAGYLSMSDVVEIKAIYNEYKSFKGQTANTTTYINYAYETIEADIEKRWKNGQLSDNAYMYLLGLYYYHGV